MGVFDDVAGLSDIPPFKAGVPLSAEVDTMQAEKTSSKILDWLTFGPLAAVVTPKEVADATVDAYKTANAVAKTPEEAKKAVNTAKVVGYGALALGAIVAIGYGAGNLAKLVR